MPLRCEPLPFDGATEASRLAVRAGVASSERVNYGERVGVRGHQVAAGSRDNTGSVLHGYKGLFGNVP